MAHSLKTLAGCFALTVLLVGCGLVPSKTSTPRLANVLTTQQQAEEAYYSGDMAHACAFYLQLTRMIPQEAEYWFMLGNTYVRTQQLDQAAQAYQEAITLEPKHTRAWHNLGIVRMRQASEAFVTSSSTAKAEDPMREVSAKLADDLGRINSGGANGVGSQVPVSTAPQPFTLAEFLDPRARVQHVRGTKSTAAGVAAKPAQP